MPTPRQKCVHPDDRSFGQRWNRCSLFRRKDQLASQIQSEDVGVARPRSRVNEKLYNIRLRLPETDVRMICLFTMLKNLLPCRGSRLGIGTETSSIGQSGSV